MGRELHADTEAASTDDHVLPYLLIELDYESGPVLVASTPYDITFNGGVFLGVGRLGSISAIQEGPEMRS